MSEIKHRWAKTHGNTSKCENCGLTTWVENPSPEMKFHVYENGKPIVSMSCGELIAGGVLDE